MSKYMLLKGDSGSRCTAGKPHTIPIAQRNSGLSQALALRIGIHIGPVVAGVIGTKKFSYDVWGDTVNTASRLESQGVSGQIQVSKDIYDVLKDNFILEERGLINLKGKGELPTYILQRGK